MRVRAASIVFAYIKFRRLDGYHSHTKHHRTNNATAIEASDFHSHASSNDVRPGVSSTSSFPELTEMVW